jgi:hypothetical protein
MPNQSIEQQPANIFSIEGLVPEVGDGNPEALNTFLENLLTDSPEIVVTSTSLKPSAWLPRIFHRIMSGSPERSAEDQILVAVQEMALKGVRSERFGTYKEVYLLIPDVLGKLPLNIADDQKAYWHNITVVVWNEYAHQTLSRAGYKVLLIKPWMIHKTPNLIANPVFPESNQNRNVYIKTSGGGWPRSWENNLLAVFNRHSIGYSLYLPGNKVSQPESKWDAITPRPFYKDFNWHPPQVLIGYPSELIQVLAAHSFEKACPKYYSLPPRGSHELINLIWAIQHGFCTGMLFPEGYTNALPKYFTSAKDSTRIFKTPEIALFTKEFASGLNPAMSYEDLMTLIINHIPLDIVIENKSFFLHQSTTSLSDEQKDALGKQSFMDQLPNSLLVQ